MRNVLIALVGMSPAVVTETIWALAHDPDDPCVPDQIVLITTQAGKEEIERHLLPTIPTSSSKLKQLAKALRDKGIEPAYAPQGWPLKVKVECAVDGEADAHADAHAVDELNHMGDAVFRVVKHFVADPDCRVILSISGGRKSMGHLGGSAMTLLAREQDFMCHVLVTPGWLEHPDLHYYFPKAEEHFTNPNPLAGESNGVDGMHSTVELTRVPFLRLNHYDSVQSLMARFDDLGFEGVIDSINNAGKPAGKKVLVIDWAAKTVRVDGLDLKDKYPKLAEQAVAYLVVLGICRRWHRHMNDDDALLFLRVWRLVDFKFNGLTISGNKARLSSCADGLFERRSMEQEFKWPSSERLALDSTLFFAAYKRTSELSCEVPAPDNAKPTSSELKSPRATFKQRRRASIEPNMSSWRTAIFKTLGSLQPYSLPNASNNFYVMPAALTLDTGDEKFDFLPRPKP